MAKEKTTTNIGKKSREPKARARDRAPDGSTVTVSREVLDATPGRLLDLLKGIGTRPAIRAALVPVGYTPEEHQRGWKLLFECSGYTLQNLDTEVDQPVIDAINALDRLDERTYRRIDASLRHRAPNVRNKLLDGVMPGTGADSVLFFATLLPRLDALARGKLAHISADEQKVAAEVLEARALGAEFREELRGLVERAQSANAVERPKGPSPEELEAALRAARAFYEEWATIARYEIRRRDHLISLGLASRRARAQNGDDEGGDETALPAVPPAPEAPRTTTSPS